MCGCPIDRHLVKVGFGVGGAAHDSVILRESDRFREPVDKARGFRSGACAQRADAGSMDSCPPRACGTSTLSSARSNPSARCRRSSDGAAPPVGGCGLVAEASRASTDRRRSHRTARGSSATIRHARTAAEERPDQLARPSARGTRDMQPITHNVLAYGQGAGPRRRRSGPARCPDHCTDASYDGLWHHAITTDRAEPNRPFHCDRCVIAADRAKIIRPSQRCLAPSMGSSAPHRHAGRACAPSPNTASHRRQTPKAHVDGQQPTGFGAFGRRGRDAINGLCAPMKNDRPWQTVIGRRT
jgi:hypothetical protein